jgi:hypothetical protein
VFLGLAVFSALTAGRVIDARAESEEPEALIKQGVALRRNGDDARAYGYFKRAYDLAQTPRSAAQLGLVEQALSRFVEAQKHLSEALATKDAWVEQNRASLESSRTFVRGRLGKVQITGAPADATVAVGSDLPFALPSDGVVWLAAGESTLVIAAHGHASFTKAVKVAAGESATVAAVLASNDAPATASGPGVSALNAAPGGAAGSPEVVTATPARADGDRESKAHVMRVAGISAAAGGLALGVAGFLVRGVATTKMDAIASDAAAGHPYNESNGNWTSFDRAGVGLLVAGGVALVGGAALYLFNLPGHGDDGGAKVSFAVLPGQSGLSLQLGGRY